MRYNLNLIITHLNNMKDIYNDRLLERGINVTAIRLLIFRAMVNYPQTFSLSDLESVLDTVDRSTLFRTISLFHNKKLIHSIDDGSGSIKYSVCEPHCNCTVNELHVHFYCEKCHKTYCLDNISIPEVSIPKKFILNSVNFVLKGICENC